MGNMILNNSELFAQVAIELKNGHEVIIPCKGTSMIPFIKNNNKVLLTAPDNLKKGDIVLFKYHGNYILHRLIKIHNNLEDKKTPTAEMMGDGILKTKELAPVENILGKVKSIINKQEQIVYPNKKSERIKWELWHLCKPIRRYLLGIYRRL